MKKNDRTSSTNATEGRISICEVMKEDTAEIIKKMESQIPSIVQNYSNLYAQYLHMLSDIFGTCYIAEKKFVDKLNIDQDILKQIKRNSESMKNAHIKNIELSSRFFDQYTKIQIEYIKSFDRFTHTLMESYANTLSQLNRHS